MNNTNNNPESLGADYRALHAAAMTLAVKMLATLSQEQRGQIARTTQQGAKLLFELEPFDCKQVALILREFEGKRTPVCRLGTTQ